MYCVCCQKSVEMLCFTVQCKSRVTERHYIVGNDPKITDANVRTIRPNIVNNDNGAAGTGVLIATIFFERCIHIIHQAQPNLFIICAPGPTHHKFGIAEKMIVSTGMAQCSRSLTLLPIYTCFP